MTVARFHLFPDGTEPVTETFAYVTDIIQHDDGTEQRIPIRAQPTRQWSMRMVELLYPESQSLLRQIEVARDFACIAPFWPDAFQLLDDALIGDTELTTDRVNEPLGFGFADSLMLWRGEQVYEFVQVESESFGVITIADPLTKNWTAGQCWLVPCFDCRIVSLGDILRPTPEAIIFTQLTVERSRWEP